MNRRAGHQDERHQGGELEQGQAARAVRREARSAACPLAAPARAGRQTSTTTVRMSSTMSQPTATWPWTVASRSRSSSTRIRTTVLATERARPRTMPAGTVQPKAVAVTTAEAAWRPRSGSSAPGHGDPWTASRSLRWKCRPTPNIRRTTPISASCEASAVSATKPGVKGPMRMPAIR